jgi:hypothetical protein
MVGLPPIDKLRQRAFGELYPPGSTFFFRRPQIWQMLCSFFISPGADLGVNRQGKWAGEPLTIRPLT